MIYPKIFEKIKNDLDVQAELGSNPVRFFPFGNVPETLKSDKYASWSVINGNPQNTLACSPKSDIWSIQVDVWANSADETRSAATALIKCLEKTCYIDRIGGDSRDFETKRYRYSFDVTIIQNRD